MEINSLSSKLLEASFSLCKNQDNKNAEMKIVDNLDDVKVLDNVVHITYSRDIYWNPQALFNIHVIFEEIIEFDENINKENFKNELNECPSKFLEPTISLAANVISNITAASGNYPLITPPVFINK